MVSYADLDPMAPFATVFTDKNMEWAAKIVSVGALFGEEWEVWIWEVWISPPNNWEWATLPP